MTLVPAGTSADDVILAYAFETGASVVSNDSFKSYQSEHPWLFEEGRLYEGDTRLRPSGVTT